MPNVDGNPGSVRGPSPLDRSTIAAAWRLTLRLAKTATSALAIDAATAMVRSILQPLRTAVNSRPATSTERGEEPGGDGEGVDDPRRQCVEPAEQIGSEADERVAEEPFQEQQRDQARQRDDQPEHICR